VMVGLTLTPEDQCWRSVVDDDQLFRRRGVIR
jgi:hypothetical protein